MVSSTQVDLPSMEIDALHYRFSFLVSKYNQIFIAYICTYVHCEYIWILILFNNSRPLFSSYIGFLKVLRFSEVKKKKLTPSQVAKLRFAAFTVVGMLRTSIPAPFSWRLQFCKIMDVCVM